MILIDMRMPKNCDECPLIEPSIGGCVIGSQGIPKRYAYDTSKKPEWCPIKAEIPKDTTNGEVIKAVFPGANVYLHGSTYSINNEYNFNETWWNAPYKGAEW